MDTGVVVSIISYKTQDSMPNLHKLSLQTTPATLQTYTGETIPILGKLSIKVEYHGQNACHPAPSSSTRRWPQSYWSELVETNSVGLEKYFYQG